MTFCKKPTSSMFLQPGRSGLNDSVWSPTPAHAHKQRGRGSAPRTHRPQAHSRNARSQVSHVLRGKTSAPKTPEGRGRLLATASPQQEMPFQLCATPCGASLGATGLRGIWGRTSSVDGSFLRATPFAGSPARSGASCSGQKGGGNYTLVCARPHRPAQIPAPPGPQSGPRVWSPRPSPAPRSRGAGSSQPRDWAAVLRFWMPQVLLH